MDGSIDPPFMQPFVQFLGPQRLAADLGQRAVLHLVTAGGDGNQFHRVFRPFMRSTQARARFMRLGHGERGAACAEA